MGKNQPPVCSNALQRTNRTGEFRLRIPGRGGPGNRPVGFCCHRTINRLTLPPWFDALSFEQSEKTLGELYKQKKGDVMNENKNQDYFDDNDEGHVDTREANFQCENPDKNLGCDLGIDVMG